MLLLISFIRLMIDEIIRLIEAGSIDLALFFLKTTKATIEAYMFEEGKKK